jgi:hypothetical protein
MAKDKRSFFERLTGTVRMNPDEVEDVPVSKTSRREVAPHDEDDVSSWRTTTNRTVN